MMRMMRSVRLHLNLAFLGPASLGTALLGAVLGTLWILGGHADLAAQQRQWTWIDGGDPATTPAFPNFYRPSHDTSGILDDGRLVAIANADQSSLRHSRVVAWSPDGQVSFDEFPSGGVGYNSVVATFRSDTIIARSSVVLRDIGNVGVGMISRLGATGERLWRTQIPDFDVVGLGVTGDGAVYAAGGLRPGIDAALVRLSDRGLVEWMRAYDGTWPGPGESQDTWWDLVVREDGSVCVTGSTFNRSGNGTDIITACYAVDGTELWFAEYDGPDGLNDVGWAIAADESGAVYIAGQQERGVIPLSVQGLTLKYSASGSLEWVRTPVDVSFGSYPRVSAENGQIVTSLIARWQDHSELVMTSHSPSGEWQWQVGQVINHSAENLVASRSLHARDASGDLYLGGQHQPEGADDYRCLNLGRYSPSGETVWTRVVCDDRDGYYVDSLQPRDDGSLSALTFVYRGVDPMARESRLADIRFSENGQLLQRTEAREIAFAYGCLELQAGGCLAIDRRGAALLASTRTSDHIVPSVSKVDAAGLTLWTADGHEVPATRPTPFAAASHPGRAAVAVGRERVWEIDTVDGSTLWTASASSTDLTFASDSTLYASDTRTLRLFDPTGSELWSLDDQANSHFARNPVVVDPLDRVVVGTRGGVKRVAPSSAVDWIAQPTAPVGETLSLAALAVADDSSVAALFWESGFDAIHVAKISEAGSVEWQRKIRGSEDQSVSAYDVKKSASGTIVVLSARGVDLAQEPLIAAYSSSGATLWSRSTISSDVSLAPGLEVDQNTVWVAGHRDNGLDDDAFVERYDLATGDLLFSDVITGDPRRDARFRSVARDPFGNVFAAGEVAGEHDLPQRLLVKYAVTGPGLVDVSKLVSGDPIPGGELTYTLTIRNSGPIAQPSVLVSDELPELTELISATSTSGTVSIDAQETLVTWSGALDLAEEATVTIWVRIPTRTRPGTLIENQATATFDTSGDTVNDGSVISSDPAGSPGSATRVIVRFPDEIFADRFETGDLRCWSEPSGPECPTFPPIH